MDEVAGERLAAAWRRLSRRNRAAFLRTLVQGVDTGEAHFLLELVKRKLSFDPLRELPAELRQQVLQHVAGPATLVRMARVCREWHRQIAEDALLWRRHSRRMRLTHSAQQRLLRSDRSVGELVRVLRWETQLRRNWERGECTWWVTIAAHGASVITCLQIDEPNSRLISGADNGSVGLWDLRTGECKAMFPGHQGGVWALRTTEDGMLVTGSTDRTLIVWNLNTGQRVWDLIGHSSTVRCVEVVGAYIVSGSRDGTLRVWDAATGRCLHILTGHTASVRCIAAWGGGHIVSGSYDHTLRLWELQSGRCVSVFRGHDGKIYSVAASPEYIFSGGIDSTIRVWRPLTGECVDVFSEHAALVGLLRVCGDLLVAGSTDGSISLWNCRTLDRVRHIELAHRSSITALDHNQFALLSGSERALRLWPLCELASEEPAEPLNLADKAEVIWRIAAAESHAAVAYQQAGTTRIDILNFAPDF